MAWHYEICPICKEPADDRGFCGCEPPFSLSAVPKEKIDGIARTIFPHIVAYVEGMTGGATKSEINKEAMAVSQS